MARFTDQYAGLPSDSPANHAHILDTSGPNKFMPRGPVNIWDAIATTFFKMGPDILEKFLNPEKTFRIIFDTDTTGMKFIVWRKGSDVLVSNSEVEF